jgi:carbon-monoxide dehydrogenase large subunit
MSQTQWVGQVVPRKEDKRFVSGRGQYIDDIRLPNMLAMAVLRSPQAHAYLLRIDVSKAQRLEGVYAVITGTDLEGYCHKIGIDTPRPGLRDNAVSVLAETKVRYVGEPVVAVAAINRYVAEDALELIEVEYEPLPVVMDAETASQPDTTLLYDEWGDNIAYSGKNGGGDLDKAFAEADGILSLKLHLPRVTAAALETRGVVANFDAIGKNLTVWAANQSGHHLRTNLAEVLGLPEQHLRVIVPDVGGAFGAKHHLYPEDVLVCVLSQITGQPVKWISDRFEDLRSTDHAREQIHSLEVAYKNDGQVTAIRGTLLADCGAATPRPGLGPIAITPNAVPGPYRLEAYQMEVKMVVTNKVPLGGLRGYGSAQATYVIERVMERVAEKLNLDPAEVRLKNLIPPSAMPYRAVTRLTTDSGDYPATLQKLLDKTNYRQLREEEAQRQTKGELYGLGVAFFNKSSGLGPSAILALTGQRGGYESARVVLEANGEVSLFVGVQSHGQGLETSLAQICADELGVTPQMVRVVQGDTDSTPYSPFGTSASRSLVVGGAAVVKAGARLREKIFALAAHVLEANPADLELFNGEVRVKGSLAKAISLAKLAETAYKGHKLPADFEAGTLSAQATYDPTNFIYTFGAHVVGLKVDRDSGLVKLEKWFALHDAGKSVNPLVVEGQLQGGLVQGLGASLLEEMVYDENGQLLSGTFMDYLLPVATDIPPVDITVQETPSPFTPGGLRGIGEAGLIPVQAVITSALARALKPLGISLEQLGDAPYTPQKLWKIMHHKNTALNKGINNSI